MPNSTDIANKKAVERISAATPFLVDIQPAKNVITGLGEWDFLHAGPPLAGWHEVACGALRGAVLGTLVRDGLAKDLKSAEALATEGAIRLHSAHDRGALGTYGGVITATTPVLVVEDRTNNTRAFAALNEGRGKALRYGSSDPETLSRLAWLEGNFAELLRAGLRLSGGIDIFAILEQALHMGDDGHSRQKAASALFAAMIAPFIVEAGSSANETSRAVRFLSQNDIFFLPLTMAAAKSAMVAAEGIAGSTVVTAIAFNGVRAEFA
jgi:hypothetical protein